MTTVACLADLHGNLPDLSSLSFDLLLLGGDLCPVTKHTPNFQSKWLDTCFRDWLGSIDRPVYGVAGNHDKLFQNHPHLIPADLPWTYLQDSGARTIGGLSIWGSPWQLPYGHGWAFNSEEPDIRKRWAAIPDDTDILLLHGTPHGYGDWSPYDHVHTGSPSLTERIMEIQPRLVVAGHIHSGRGIYRIGETMVVNAAHVGEDYRVVGGPVVVEI